MPQTGGQSKVTTRILGVYLYCLAGDCGVFLAGGTGLVLAVTGLTCPDRSRLPTGY
jgi:hypothetical protein